MSPRERADSRPTLYMTGNHAIANRRQISLREAIVPVLVAWVPGAASDKKFSSPAQQYFRAHDFSFLLFGSITTFWFSVPFFLREVLYLLLRGANRLKNCELKTIFWMLCLQVNELGHIPYGKKARLS